MIMLKKGKNLTRPYTVITCLLIILVITPQSIISVSEQESLEEKVKESLKESFHYLLSNIDEDGLAVEYKTEDMIKATARLGLLAGYIHMGLRDYESLMVLNKIADALFRVSTNLDDSIQDERDKILTKYALIEFSVTHYGLTGSETSKNMILKSCSSLVEKLGWLPTTSCSSYLIYSGYISYIAGGKISRDDIRISLEDVKEHYLEFINYTSWGGLNLATGLEILSVALRTASIANIDPPAEVVALWITHLNHSLQYITQENSELPSEEIKAYLNAFISALEVPYPTSLRNEAIVLSEELAEKLLEYSLVGGRLLLQSRNAANYLVYDPSLNYIDIITILRNHSKLKVYDLDIPIMLERLSRIENVKNAEKYRDASTTIASIVSSSKPYFKVVDEKITPNQVLIDIIFSTRFLATWYSLQKLKPSPIAELTIQAGGFSYITLTSCSILLLTLLLLYRFGKLIREEEE